MVLRSTIAFVFMLFGAGVDGAFAQARDSDVRIIYPKDHSVVYDKVNLVLDPTQIPFFQVTVGAAKYPVMDTSSGRHAYQGLELTPGINKITVNVFTPSSEPAGNDLKLVASRDILVFSRVDIFAKGNVPEGFREMFFHTREQETSCSSCHKLKTGKVDTDPQKPEDVICYTCHGTMPAGDHAHPPAAAWDCLACHDPDLYPVKYQFRWYDPWKVTKDAQPVQQLTVAVSSAELFEPRTDALVSRDKVREVFKDVLNHARQYPGDKVSLEVHLENVLRKKEREKTMQNSGDRVRLEAHSDDTLMKKGTGAAGLFSDNQALADARARKLAAFLLESGIKEERLMAVGKGDRLSAARDETGAERELDDRVEIVIQPPDVTMQNNSSPPLPQDRERIMVNFAYSQGPEVKKLKVLVKVPKGTQYVKGSAAMGGRPAEPVVAGDELIWELGDAGSNFSENLTYVMRKEKSFSTESAQIKVAYTADDYEITRELGPKAPVTRVRTVEDTCMKCHAGITDGKYRHGPVGTGYCNLCHNPHASTFSSLLRRPVRLLCTECHAEKAAGIHVLAGFVKGASHPTKGRKDPARPGKELTCTGCHNPHSAESESLFAHNAKTRYQLCMACHPK